MYRKQLFVRELGWWPRFKLLLQPASYELKITEGTVCYYKWYRGQKAIIREDKIHDGQGD